MKKHVIFFWVFCLVCSCVWAFPSVSREVKKPFYEQPSAVNPDDVSKLLEDSFKASKASKNNAELLMRQLENLSADIEKLNAPKFFILTGIEMGQLTEEFKTVMADVNLGLKLGHFLGSVGVGYPLFATDFTALPELGEFDATKLTARVQMGIIF